MKKKILLLTMLLLFCFAGTAFAADVTVKVDGKELPQKGVIVDGRTMVPIRDIAEAVGVDVEYNADTEIVWLSIGGVRFASMEEEIYQIKKVTKSYGDYYVSGSWEFFDSDVPMQNINGKMMMPLKVAAEMVGVNTSWDGVNRVASVISKQSAVSDDGKIDLMSNIDKHPGSEYGKAMSEKGFEVKELVAYWDKYANSWAVDCRFENVTDKHFSAAIYVIVLDKSGNLVESSSRLYKDSWQPGEGGLLAEVFHKYDPQLHVIDVVVD